MDQTAIVEFARHVILVHGRAAPDEAANHEALHESAGDQDMAVLWRRVGAAIAKSRELGSRH